MEAGRDNSVRSMNVVMQKNIKHVSKLSGTPLHVFCLKKNVFYSQDTKGLLFIYVTAYCQTCCLIQ